MHYCCLIGDGRLDNADVYASTDVNKRIKCQHVLDISGRTIAKTVGYTGLVNLRWLQNFSQYNGIQIFFWPWLCKMLFTQ